MTQIFSVLALKGGVGKTTTAVALAHMFAAELGRRVLVIDLDPQASASEMLIGGVRLGTVVQSGRTIAHAFRDPASPGPRWLPAAEVILTDVGGIAGLDGIDLLPASAELYAATVTQPGNPAAPDAHARLRDYCAAVLDRYDTVIIDCAPNFGDLTQNGLFLSDGFLIPVIPDLMSTRGIPVLLRMVKDFSTRTGHVLFPLGLVAVKLQVSSGVHIETLARLRTLEMLIPVFPQAIPQSNHIAAAAVFGPVSSIAQKWGRPAITSLLRGLSLTVSQRLDQICPRSG